MNKLLEPVAVIGLGYVGLELALGLVQTGRKVVGIDVSREKIEVISRGVSPVENVSSEAISKAVHSKLFQPTLEFSAISCCKTVIVCVPTPLFADNTPNLEYMETAINEIAKYVKSGTLIVNESTSYPGTLRNFIAPRVLALSGLSSADIDFAVAPERVSPGSGIPISKIPRVVGALSEESLDKVLELYETICDSVRAVSSPEVAESAKLLENTFRLVNISFINEFNLICRKLGIETTDVIEAAATKPYGFMPFYPSPGAGGHCIPVDPMYLQHTAEQLAVRSDLVDLAFEINRSHPVNLIERALVELPKSPESCLILGLSYKSGISDTRESASEIAIDHLRKKISRVGWIDPLVKNWRGEESANLESQWDIAFLFTFHEKLPISKLLNSGTLIFDFTGKAAPTKGIVRM